MKKKIKEFIIIISIFIILAFIFTYPVIINITTHSAGDGGDGLQFIWNIWHINKVITQGGSIQDIYFTNELFYPYGTSLAFHTLSLTNTLFLGFPLTIFIDNLNLIYNLLFLFNFVLAGFGMYTLIKYLIKDKGIAFVCGFAYAFSPFMMAKGLGYLNFMSIGWIPLFFLYLIKTLKENKYRNVIISTIFLFFLSLACWYYLFYTFIISFFYFFYILIKKEITFNKKLLKRLILFIVLFFTFISPFLIPMISEYIAGGGYQESIRISSIKPYHYIIPSFLHSFWGEKMSKFITLNIIENLMFLGYFIILLSIIYFLKTRKQIFWLFILILFFIFSLFPNNLLLVSLIKILPFYNVISNTSRFSFGVLFSIIIIFGYSLEYFIPIWKNYFKQKIRIKEKLLKEIILFLIFSIIVFEFISIPYPLFPGSQNIINGFNFVKEKDEIDFKILSLPINANPKELYFQTFHEKKIIGGYTSRTNPNSKENLKKLSNIINNQSLNEFNRFIKENEIRYIILYDRLISNKEEELKLNFLLEQKDIINISKGDLYHTTIFEVIKD